MSVESQPGFIILSEDESAKRLQLQRVKDQKSDIDVALADLTDRVLPSYVKAVADWQKAGNSDKANKEAKIAYYRGRVAATKEEIKALEKESRELGYQITALNTEITSLERQIKSFREAYRQALMQNKSPNEAAAEAEEAAKGQKDKDALRANFFKNKFVIAGIVVVAVGLIVFLIFKLKK